MHSTTKLPTALIVSALLIFGSSLVVKGVTDKGPSDQFSTGSSTALTDQADVPTADTAVSAVEAFVTAATADSVAQAFPDSATPDTFAVPVSMIGDGTPADRIVAVLSDLAMIRISNPHSKVTVEVEQSQVVVAGNEATVPPHAVHIMVDDQVIENNEEIAAQLGHLQYSRGSWSIALPGPADTINTEYSTK